MPAFRTPAVLFRSCTSHVKPRQCLSFNLDPTSAFIPCLFLYSSQVKSNDHSSFVAPLCGVIARQDRLSGEAACDLTNPINLHQALVACCYALPDSWWPTCRTTTSPCMTMHYVLIVHVKVTMQVDVAARSLVSHV